MCGISGVKGLTDFNTRKETLGLMNDFLSHRGPDDEGTFYKDDVGLGHRRLAIIDLSPAGHQPMHYHERYSIVFNGEIYNYKEVAKKLNEPLVSNSDTEVILAAYAKWGKSCLEHLNGMFAFAIYDSIEKELFIARDRLGIKPLYYFTNGNCFLFASEVRALLNSGLIPRKLDNAGLSEYLQYQTVHAPRTIIKDIKMLMPGHFMVLKNNNIEIKEWWKLPEQTIEPDKNYSEVCRDVNKLLYEAVERRLIADVPFGAFLSGGIDSTAVVGLMSKIKGSGVKTFSVTFSEDQFSEASFARLVADKFKTEHHEIKLSVEDFKNSLPNALKAMDHPSGDGPNTYIVSGATKGNGITMALSGLGGDELFGGYPVFGNMKYIKPFSSLPSPIRSAAARVIIAISKSYKIKKLSEALMIKKLEPASFYRLSRQIMLDNELESLLVNSQHNSISDLLKTVSGKSESLISTVSHFEISTYLQNVLLRDTDQMTMAHALEVRVPFMDYHLVEYVMQLPDKFKEGMPKKLLIDSLKDFLPDEVVFRKKMGFTLPWKHWLADDLKDFAQERIHTLAKRSSFNKSEILNLWKSFISNDPQVPWFKIWYLVVLEDWLTRHNVN